jgi:hypothetical protein
MNQTYNNDVASKVIDVAIYDTCEPVLKSSPDPYPLTVRQQAPGVVDVPEGTVYVRVDGPHQRLLPDDVAGVYPADGSNNSPEEFLPHIALTRRTLPWDRLGPDGDDRPWLALLLFAESELTPVNGKLVYPATVASLKTEDKPCYDALIAAKYEDGDTLDFIKVDANTLKSVLPLKAELSLLSHVQHLILEPGETAADASDPMWAHDPDCYVAIVVGNRLPNTDGAQPPQKYWACLCSVERRGDLKDLPWPDKHEASVSAVPMMRPSPVDKLAPAVMDQVVSAVPVMRPPPTMDVVERLARPVGPSAVNPDMINPNVIGRFIPIAYDHLVVLQHWSFTPAVGGDFEQVVTEMRYSPNGGVLRFGDVPVTPTKTSITTMVASDSSLQLARAQGGQVKYHGPLVAQATTRSPDFALRSSYTENAGEDDSYSSAFEVGRLLSVSNDGVLDDLQQVRQALNPPIIAPVAGVINLPAAIENALWSPDPPWDNAAAGGLVSLPATTANNTFADPTGVAAIMATNEVAQIASVLSTAQAPGQATGGGVIDVNAASSQELDLRFSQLIALAQP